MSFAHKLSMELRAAEDRTQQMAREVETGETRAARAEQWLRTIQQEIEENYALGDRSPARKRSQSVSLTVFVATFSRCRRYPFGTKSRDAYNSRRN